ncbi:class I SAM-dependent methyltransferase [Viridibacillus sp. YIM B01967]|uniref:Class I SAM-dependent methyltransferase n=1 Tax=Viridibacillus soli TaxID=2798301 RepID=A0ABS1HB58_9BACL|nr:methyltransferase [Viridibacillus soli]MBK3496652.1 class I SAM-dependent methyltransferase [Viridibacillus soli]
MNEQQYDKFLHIQTVGDEFGYPTLAHYHRYEPTPYVALEQFFDTYQLASTDHVVDMGCGKGRVPFYIHHRFQTQVVGVEMNPTFYDSALMNKTQYTKKFRMKSASIDFQCVLAQDYIVKHEDNVFFFFNPFSIQIFRKVINNILQSIEEVPRQIHVILYYPSLDYVQFLQYETNFELQDEILIKELSTHNPNERILSFRYL